VAGLGVYLASRALGASRTGAWVAVWLGAMAPGILAQATASTDEVLAAVPLLLGLVFARDYWVTGRRRYAILAGRGVGLGLGTKLHWVFYWVFAAAALVWCAIHGVRTRAFRADLLRRAPALLAAAGIAAALGGAFVVCNYISTGHITNSAFNSVVLNQPFRPGLAVEKIQVNTAELFLSPIPDLIPPTDPVQRRAAYLAFNRFFIACCFRHLVDAVQSQSTGDHVFPGPANPEGYLFYEYTWLGFLPHLMLLVCLVAVVSTRLPRACLVLGLSFFAWHLTDAAMTRYQAGYIYYSYAALLAVAIVGPAWDMARRGGRAAARTLMVVFLLVFATHGLLAYNLLVFGGMRNVRFLWNGRPVPDPHPVSAPVAEAIRSARKVYMPFTHWETLYWNSMRFNPAARYTTGEELSSPGPDTLTVLSM